MLLSRRCHTQGDMDAGAAGVVLAQSEGSANGRIETAVKAAADAALQHAKHAGQSCNKQTDAGVRAGKRARWDVTTREVRECDLRRDFKLSDAAYSVQRSACRKAYNVAVDARRPAAGDVSSSHYAAVEGQYTAISCGWSACSGHAARDFKLLVMHAMQELLLEDPQELDIIHVTTRHGPGHGHCVLVYAATPSPKLHPAVHRQN